MSHSNKIHNYMTKLFQAYKNLQVSNNEKDIKFWDLIILTTYDQEQKKCFEKQIQELMGHVSLLKDRVYVVSDPENKKLGCGGSTLHVIKTFQDTLNISLCNKRILIIHSGGSSQRLPSYSVQGKIFSPVPVEVLNSGSRVSYMLDVKLALYLPFCNLLRPGIFVTCGDDIETFCFDTDKVDVEELQKADVVALAHPCDIETAVGHGVYVIPEKITTLRKSSSVIVSDCLEVLQKPSIDLMRNKNATFIENDEEKVYSDSVFWLSEKVYHSLLSWYTNATIDAELDAYGHFLPCLGSNVKSLQQHVFDDYKTQLLPILKEFDLKLIILNVSQFYHLGTMEEYLFNFTSCPFFCNELNLVKNTSNVLSPCLYESNEHKRGLVISCFLLKNHLIMLTNESQLIAEWSVIETPLCVHKKLILSNCVIKRCQGVEFLQKKITCFGSFLYHTVPLCQKETIFYVTIAYETTANLKSSFTDFASMKFASVSVKDVLFLAEIKESEAAADGKPFSLWNLRLFKSALTPEESFTKTHNFINKILSWKDKSIPMQTKLNSNETSPVFSMKQIMKFKDLDTFLSNRKKLIERINSDQEIES